MWFVDSDCNTVSMTKIPAVDFFVGGIEYSGVFNGVNASSQIDVDTCSNADFPDGRSLCPMMAFFAYRRVLCWTDEFSPSGSGRSCVASAAEGMLHSLRAEYPPE